MSRTRYFCVATKTTIETDKDNKIKVAPETQVILFVNMDVGIRSILYTLWAESQTEPSADNEVRVDVQNNMFHLVQKMADGTTKYVTWLAIPCCGIKGDDGIKPVKEIENSAIDFVGEMYAKYSTARTNYINSMISNGMTDAVGHNGSRHNAGNAKRRDAGGQQGRRGKFRDDAE